MNRDVYDPECVRRLVSLLRSITAEIAERGAAIDTLEELAEHGRSAVDQATLALHRRELRLATRELARLGCALDEDHPLRVLIPGANGDFANGWSWTPADERLQPAN